MTDIGIELYITLGFVVSLVPFVGLFMAITPYLVKKTECFAVTVPEIAYQDGYLNALKRSYAAIIACVTIVFSLVCLILLVQQKAIETVIVSCIAACLVALIGYSLMLRNRRKVRRYKAEQNWKAETQESVAIIGEFDMPKPISLWWNLLYIPLIAVTLLIGYLGFDAMPDQVPMNIGLDGQTMSTVLKNPLIIWLPVMIQVFLALCFIMVHWAIVRSKKTADPVAPATTAYSYGLFARAQSIYMLACGVLFDAALVLMPLSFMETVSLGTALVALILILLALTVAGIVLSVVYGQGGARLVKRTQTTEALLADEDKYWKLGMLYFNPEDPNLFLPARFGIGWMCNFARPLVWVLAIAGAILTALPIAVAALFL